MRLDGTITDERLRTAIIAAILSINWQLRAWRTAQQAAGLDALASASTDGGVDGQPRAAHLYLRAVMCSAKADLTERYRDFDASAGNTRAQDNTPAIDEQRRNAQWAVRELLGEPHTMVELI